MTVDATTVLSVTAVRPRFLITQQRLGSNCSLCIVFVISICHVVVMLIMLIMIVVLVVVVMVPLFAPHQIASGAVGSVSSTVFGVLAESADLIAAAAVFFLSASFS